MTVSKTIRLGYNSGATGLTANVYADDATLINASPLTVTESSQPGKYTFVLTDAVAGVLTTYSVNLIRGGGVVGVWYADLIETAGTYKTFDGPTPLQNATAVANTLFVDGAVNQLKVNSDHTVGTSSSGGGANAVTITILDSSNVAIQFATVSAWSGSTLMGTATTNASGVTSPPLSLDNGTYTINITAAGFNGSAGNSLVVSGATAHTYNLTALSITPSDPPFVTGYLKTRVAGIATAGIAVAIAMTRTATGETGSAYVGQPIVVISDVSGIATFTNLSPGAKYAIRMDVDGIEWASDFVADDSTFEIKSFVG